MYSHVWKLEKKIRFRGIFRSVTTTSGYQSFAILPEENEDLDSLFPERNNVHSDVHVCDILSVIMELMGIGATKFSLSFCRWSMIRQQSQFILRLVTGIRGCATDGCLCAE